MNWAPYAVYNPQLWHWPETWPLVSLSPTVEPFIVIGYATFYMAPFFPAVLAAPAPAGPPAGRVLRLAAPAAQPVGADPRHRVRVRRHARDLPRPHAAVHLLAGDPVRAPSPPGESYQFPLIWESVLVSTVMIPAGVLLYRDDTGRTQAEKLAQKVRAFRGRPALGTFARDVRHHQRRLLLPLRRRVRAHRRSRGRRRRSPARGRSPRPRSTTRRRFYEEAGQPGPYFPGIWSGWQSGQPDGRPDVDPPADGGRCGAGGG